jgi:uncharacterized protein YjiS (DUF1127 family)
MATFDTTRTTYGSASVASRFSKIVSDMTASFVAWNDARVTRNALSALSDRELEDIGLIRGDIDSVTEHSFKR